MSYPIRRLPTLLLPAIAAGCASADGCTKGPPGYEEVTAYHAASTPPRPAPAADSSIDAYYDYSRGMGEGMRAAERVNQALNDFLGGRKVQYFRVGDTPEPAPIASMTSPEANLMNLDNFKDMASRLQPVLRRIVSNSSRQSVFITDFEATVDQPVRTPGSPGPHRIDTKAWGQEAFRSWLRAGHRLDIFAFRYQKPDYWFGKPSSPALENWVYTLVFTPTSLLADAQASRSTLLAYLTEVQERMRSPDFVHYGYWTGDLPITARNDNTTGNANPDSPVTDFGIGAEHDFHAFQMSAVADWLEALAEEKNADRRLLSGRTVKPGPAFPGRPTFGLTVTDVTAAEQAFREATQAVPPDTLRDKETGKITLLDPKNGKPVTTAPPSPSASRPATGAPAKSVLALVYNRANGEVGIKLDAGFNGLASYGLYRADLVIEEVVPTTDAAADRTLSLGYTGGFRVTALAESINLALRDVTNNMRNRVLLSSYLRLDP